MSKSLRRVFAPHWEDIKGNAKWQIVLSAPTVAGAAIAFLMNAPWLIILMACVGMFIIGWFFLVLVLEDTLSIKALTSFVMPKEDIEFIGYVSQCVLLVRNNSDKTISDIKLEVIGLEIPGALRGVESISLALLQSPENTTEYKLNPGQSLKLILFDDVSRVNAFDQERVIAKQIGNWGNPQIFKADLKYAIRFKLTAENMAESVGTYYIEFVSPSWEFTLRPIRWYHKLHF